MPPATKRRKKKATKPGNASQPTAEQWLKDAQTLIDTGATISQQAATSPQTRGLEAPASEIEVDVESIEVAAATGEPAKIGPAVDQVLDHFAAEGIKILNAALPPDHPDRLIAWDAETLRLLDECAADVNSCKAEHDTKKEAAKEAKDALDAAWDREHRTILERRAGRGKPVQATIDFDRPASAEPAPLVEVSDADDGWKALGLDELVKVGLKQRVADILSGTHGLTTLGKLNEYVQPKASGWTPKWSDLKKGIGKAADDQIGDAFAQFFALWATRKKDGPTNEAAEGIPPATGDNERNGEPAGAGELPTLYEPPVQGKRRRGNKRRKGGRLPD